MNKYAVLNTLEVLLIILAVCFILNDKYFTDISL